MARWTLCTPMKVALPCLILGTAFFLVSFSVTSWVKLSYGAVDMKGGLWKACADGKGYTVCSTWSDDSFRNLRRDWMHKNQALQCLALILLLGAVGALVVFCITTMKAAIVTWIVTCFMAAFFAVLGCALFASDVGSDPLYSAYGRLDWAFGFSIVSAVLLTATGVALVVHVLLSTTTSSTSTTTTTTATTTTTTSHNTLKSPA